MSVLSVSLSETHAFHKHPVPSITLLANLGVEGDCHLGTTVQHLSRIKADPTKPNLRQVHLIHSELFVEFLESGFQVFPGQLGENITTVGVDLLALSAGTLLHFLNDGSELSDAHAVVKLTGLRNPCPQIDKFQNGLKEVCLLRDENWNIVGRKAGVMGVVEKPGIIEKGARIVAEESAVYVKMEQV